jgi:hypothetical protein
VTRHGAARAGVIFVFPRMAHHLSHDAATAPQGAAEIFATLTVLFRNLVALTDRLAGAAKRVQGPDRKQQITHITEHGNKKRTFIDGVGHGSEFEGYRVDEKGDDQHQNHRKGLSRAIQRTRLTEPSQLHTSHDLTHGKLRAAKRAPERRVTEPGFPEIADPILPVSRGGCQAWSIIAFGKRRKKDLAFFDATFGLQQERGTSIDERNAKK